MNLENNYIVVRAETLNDLEENVQSLIKRGYRPHGNLIIIPFSKYPIWDVVVFYQPMFRRHNK